MILFTIAQDEISWDVSGEHATELWLETNRSKMEKYANEIETYVEQILGIEHMLNSNNIQLKLVGDDNISIDFFVFKDTISTDRSNELFFECLCIRKNRILNNFKNVIQRMDKEEITIRWDDDFITLIDRVWIIDHSHNLKSYVAIEEE